MRALRCYLVRVIIFYFPTPPPPKQEEAVRYHSRMPPADLQLPRPPGGAIETCTGVLDIGGIDGELRSIRVAAGRPSGA